jgi:hypothetical protein
MYVDEPVREENTNISELLNYLFTLIGSKRKMYRNKNPIVKRNMIFMMSNKAYSEEPLSSEYTSLNFVENVLLLLTKKNIVKFMTYKQSIRFIRVVKQYVLHSLLTDITFISEFNLKKIINNNVTYNKSIITINNILELLMKKHNITEQDILNSCPDYSSTKLKAFPVNIINPENWYTINKSHSKTVKARPELAPSVRPSKGVSKSVAKPASKHVPRSTPNPVSKPVSRSVRKPAPKLETRKQPSNNKRKTHNRINNNLETRAKIIREKLAKREQKTILKNKGIAIEYLNYNILV